MRGKTCLLMALAWTLLPSPSIAQELLHQEPLRVAEMSIADAQARGALLFAYDQVAWHGTDAFLADLERTGADASWLRGFIVVPDGGDKLAALSFGERNGVLVEVARYGVDGGQVTGGGLRDRDAAVPLSGDALRMATVQRAVLDQMARRQYGLCARSNANTIIFPPALDGSITAYVMTPPITNDAYPLGGHYRFVFDVQGEEVAHRRFLNSCFDLRRTAPGMEDGEPVMMVVSHILDPQPTEVHFFASYYAPLQLGVATVGDGGTGTTLWRISRGQLMERVDFPDDAGAQ